MSITIEIPSYLQTFVNNLETLQVEGDTIGTCLHQLVTQLPPIEEKLFTRDQKLHPYVGIYINREDAYPDELTKPVKDGDQILILYVIGGG